MNNNNKPKQISNPFSTGGGGASFENLVAAYYVSNLMSDKLIYGHIEGGLVKEIAFQNRWIGLDVDDILIYGSTLIPPKKHERTIRAKLALQVKSRLNFRVSDSKFNNVIKDCWETFNHSSFNPGYDKIGIMLNNIIQKVKDHFIRLLDWASTSSNSTDFFSKVNLENYASQEMRDYLEIIKTILPNAQENNLWEFLKHLEILELDLLSPNSKSYLEAIESLRNIVKNKDYNNGIILFSYIFEKCSFYNKNGGQILFNTIFQDKRIYSIIKQRDTKNYWGNNWGTSINHEFLENLINLSKKSRELRENFNNLLLRLEEKKTKEVQDQIESILAMKDKNEDILNTKRVLEYQLNSINRICVLSVFNQLSEVILEFFESGFKLSLRIQENFKFISPSIYKAIGLETAVPYLESEFFSHKIRTIFERYYERYPNFRESIIYFYQGFFIGLTDSIYYDSTILYVTEKSLDFLYEIGYKTLETKEDTFLYDLTNQFVIELCHKLAVKSPTDLGKPNSLYTTVFNRILSFVNRKTVEFRDNRPLLIGVKLNILSELFSLPIPIHMRLPTLDYFIKALKGLLKVIDHSSIYHVYFFSTLQKIWVQLFQTSSELNPRLYQKFLLELLKIYSSAISLRIKSDKSVRSHPFVNQMNRTFIDLQYYLIRSSAQIEKNTNIINIYSILNKQLLDIGDNLFKNYPEKDYYKCILEPLAMIRFLMINHKIEAETAIISQEHVFDSLCSIGCLVLMSLLYQEENETEINYQFNRKVQDYATKAYPFDEFTDCIETRQGNWNIFGMTIGTMILQFHNLFTDPKTVYKVLKLIKFIK